MHNLPKETALSMTIAGVAAAIIVFFNAPAPPTHSEKNKPTPPVVFVPAAPAPTAALSDDDIAALVDLHRRWASADKSDAQALEKLIVAQHGLRDTRRAPAWARKWLEDLKSR